MYLRITLISHYLPIFGYILCDYHRMIWFPLHNVVMLIEFSRMDPVLDHIFINTLKYRFNSSILTCLISCITDTWVFLCSLLPALVSQLLCALLLSAYACDLQRLAFGHWSLLAHKENQKAGEFSRIWLLYDSNLYNKSMWYFLCNIGEEPGS